MAGGVHHHFLDRHSNFDGHYRVRSFPIERVSVLEKYVPAKSQSFGRGGAINRTSLELSVDASDFATLRLMTSERFIGVMLLGGVAVVVIAFLLNVSAQW
jgi:hypothetical protein